MPTRYNRKGDNERGKWSEEDLFRAVQAVKESDMGVNQAALDFNIPKTTLKRRLKAQVYTKGGLGPSSVLGSENERKIVSHIKKLQSHGFAPSRDSTRIMAFKLAENLNLKHNFDRNSQISGYDWLKSFLVRNPDLSIRKAEGVSVSRALEMNKPFVENYFNLLQTIMVENQLLGKLGNIFNMDETGMRINNRPSSVIAVKGSRSVTTITSAEKGETISVLACCNGDGTFLPPYCIFKGKNKKEELSDGIPPGTVVKMSQKSAYVNSDIFFDWLKNHFVLRKPAGKVLLIVDGHTSHSNSVEMLEYSEQENIILMSLPSHTTYYLQPLDRAFFKTLKSNYYRLCNSNMINHPSRKITRLQLGSIFGSAWNKSATVENAVSAFRSTGIIPLNRTAILEYAFLTKEPEMQGILGSVPEISNTTPEPIPGPSTASADNEDTTHTANATSASPTLGKDANDQPTPSKLLDAISPVPVVEKVGLTQMRQRSQNVAKILNSLENILQRKGKKRKVNSAGLSQKKNRTKSTPMRRDEEYSSSDDEKIPLSQLVEDSSDDLQEFDENECVGCGEEYEKTTRKDDWIQCVSCIRWLHEGCSSYANLNKCLSCGKKE